MLAEIAIANAAFGVIKEAIGNGKDLYEMGGAVAQFFDQKNALQKKSNKNGYKSDMEAFMELEKIKEMEEHLKQQMIWAGRPGMWDDWLAFQKQAKEEREKVEREARAKRAYYAQMALYCLYAVCGLGLFLPLLFLILTILKP
tara:strand:+ start:473 stop:901 length:429 start_codon:yes stop_codon:yes gene_type:complete